MNSKVIGQMCFSCLLIFNLVDMKTSFGEFYAGKVSLLEKREYKLSCLSIPRYEQLSSPVCRFRGQLRTPDPILL